MIEGIADGSIFPRVTVSILLLLLTFILFYTLHMKVNYVYRWADSGIKKLFVSSCIIGYILTVSLILVYTWGMSNSVVNFYITQIKKNLIVNIIVTVSVLLSTYVLTGALDEATKQIFRRDGRQVVDEHRREVVFRVCQICLYFIVTVSILNYWQIDIQNLLLGAGVITVVIGLSARQTLSSALAGTVLLFSRPFKVGDWIEVGNHEGVVRRITIINTLLRTPDKEEVVIPNDRMSEETVKNKSCEGSMRVSVDVSVSYDEDLNHAKNVAKEAVIDCNNVQQNSGSEPFVRVTEFNNSSVTLTTFIWIKRPTPGRKETVLSSARQNIYSSFNENNIEIPYPHRTIVEK